MPPHHGLCPGHEHAFSRRLFLQGLVAGGCAFGGFGRLFAADNATQAARRQKHVILVFMSGGPSQFETWDPKPGQWSGGPHLTIPTSLPGIHFDEFLPNLARLARKLVTIRSMTSPFGEHSEGAQYTQTATRPSPVVAPPPHWLSVCAQQQPALRPELPSALRRGHEFIAHLDRKHDMLRSASGSFTKESKHVAGSRCDSLAQARTRVWVGSRRARPLAETARP
jgi:hypothetical protein